MIQLAVLVVTVLAPSEDVGSCEAKKWIIRGATPGGRGVDSKVASRTVECG